jgi:hypothetical protein
VKTSRCRESPGSSFAPHCISRACSTRATPVQAGTCRRQCRRTRDGCCTSCVFRRTRLTSGRSVPKHAAVRPGELRSTRLERAKCMSTRRRARPTESPRPPERRREASELSTPARSQRTQRRRRSEPARRSTPATISQRPVSALRRELSTRVRRRAPKAPRSEGRAPTCPPG